MAKKKPPAAKSKSGVTVERHRGMTAHGEVVELPQFCVMARGQLIAYVGENENNKICFLPTSSILEDGDVEEICAEVARVVGSRRECSPVFTESQLADQVKLVNQIMESSEDEVI